MLLKVLLVVLASACIVRAGFSFGGDLFDPDFCLNDDDCDQPKPNCHNNLCVADQIMTATCDNRMKVYIDGVKQTGKPNVNNWRETDTFTVPQGTQVVAIECEDRGYIAGILASIDDGTVTDSSWDCSLNPTSGWKKAGFTPDASWQSANTFGQNPSTVYPVWGTISGISSNAHWIWSSQSDIGVTLHCRKELSSSIPCSPSCKTTEDCVNGKCVCKPWFKGDDCEIPITCPEFHTDDSNGNDLIENGYCRLPTTWACNAVVEFECYSKYRLEGPKSTKCMLSMGEGQWVPDSLPICVRITCPKIGIFDDGTVDPSSAQTTDVLYKKRTKACFTCDDGNPPKPDTCMECKKDSADVGYWSPPTPPDCHPCRATRGEIVVVMDESGSINSNDFTREKDFAKTLAFNLRLDFGLMRMGVMTFASSIRLITHVDNPATSTVADMETKINTISQYGGGTDIEGAIQYAHLQMLDPSHVRSGVPRYMIVISDGVSATNPIPAAIAARSNGITVFSLGVGGGVNQAQMEAIASEDPASTNNPKARFYFFVSNFSELVAAANQISKVVCENISGLQP